MTGRRSAAATGGKRLREQRVAEAAGAGAPAAPFTLGVRVYYEDTDAVGIVYYANYLRYMERARTEWLESLGFPLAAFEQAHAATFAVHRAKLDFLRPARLNDRLDVSVEPALAHGAQLDVMQTVSRDGALLVRASISLACVDLARLVPKRIPPPLVALVRREVRACIPLSPSARPISA